MIEWWFPLFIVFVTGLIFYAVWTTLMTLAGEFQKYMDQQEFIND